MAPLLAGNHLLAQLGDSPTLRHGLAKLVTQSGIGRPRSQVGHFVGIGGQVVELLRIGRTANIFTTGQIFKRKATVLK